MIVGPEGSISALVAAAILSLAAAASPDAAELASFLALLVGACFLLAWLLRLHWISDYFSRPVLVGYIHGVAAVLVRGALPSDCQSGCGQCSRAGLTVFRS